MSTTPVANCHWYQRHRQQICHRCQRHRCQTMRLISGWGYLKVNLKAKIYVYVNSSIQRCPNKIIKIFQIEDFFICHRCRWHRWSTLSCKYLREFWKKFKTVLMGYSGAGGKLIHKINQKQKISWHCPFKWTFAPMDKGTILVYCCPSVQHVTGNDKDYLRKIPRVVW